MIDLAKKPPTSTKTKKTAPTTSTKTKITAPKRYDDILTKLEHLRSMANEVCRIYIANIERDIVEVEDLVKASRQQSLLKKKVSVSALDEAAEILNTLSLKPKKGRRGDFKKIEKAVLTMKRTLAQKKV